MMQFAQPTFVRGKVGWSWHVDMEQMTRVAQAAAVRPILLTVLPVDRPVFSDVQTKVAALDAATQAMAKRQDVTVLDAASQFNRHRPLWELFRHSDGREDGVHPNDAGYRLLARLVAARVALH